MPDPVKPEQSPEPARRSRGRPRNLEARQAILAAARDLMAAGGPGAVTMEAVAARAGVGKPTVYRWWPDRHAVAMAALMSEVPTDSADTPALSPVAALHQHLRDVAAAFATPSGRNAASLIAAADSATELAKAFRNHFVMARREEGRALLASAVEAGELRADLDADIALDLLYGPVFFRLLMGHAPLSAAAVDAVIANVLRGLARETATA
ncbi:TetR/AcrR family transcriptional regulator [Tahibacter amnicola]|uniref:TetR/AcrR family transcriptional regulator n=1 Tax=Tahibacter amnicola TaxID=2976241 RepID=A0ABY6BBG3_9GAMM|nr:TetR/AcrR family transcriptional regulator [Tahibacter amnicola]UXI66877.1 TetR/AcrR family transcriptional regulator [Tahibacter amnicola]